MRIFETIPGLGKIVGVLERLVAVGEALIGNTDIMERFHNTGKMEAGFTVYDYRVEFQITDSRKNTLPAEIVDDEGVE